MLPEAIMSKAPVRRYQESFFVAGHGPEQLIGHPFVGRAANIEYIVPQTAQLSDA